MYPKTGFMNTITLPAQIEAVNDFNTHYYLKEKGF